MTSAFSHALDNCSQHTLRRIMHLAASRKMRMMAYGLWLKCKWQK